MPLCQYFCEGGVIKVLCCLYSRVCVCARTGGFSAATDEHTAEIQEALQTATEARNQQDPTCRGWACMQAVISLCSKRLWVRVPQVELIFFFLSFLPIIFPLPLSIFPLPLSVYQSSFSSVWRGIGSEFRYN